MDDNRYIFGLPKCLFVLLILLFFALSLASPLLYCNLDSGIGGTDDATLVEGFTGTFIAWGSAALTFVAFWVQYKANLQQREDLKVERFEHNFFELLHLFQQVVEELDLDLSLKGDTIYNKRDVFQRLYEGNPTKLPNLEQFEQDCTVQSSVLKFGIQVYARYDKLEIAFASDPVHSLDHYFRLFYRILKYVDESSLSDSAKYSYIGIQRSLLSQYELLMIYYNGKKFHKLNSLINKYAILKNIRVDLLAKDSEQEELKAFNENTQKNVVDVKFQLKYEPSAFRCDKH